MMGKGRTILLVIAVFALSVAARSGAAEIRPIELLKNGGVEEVKNGIPTGWKVDNAGKLSSDGDARTGKLSAKFEAIEHAWGYCAFYSGIDGINPKAIYHLSLWAKGKGTVSTAVYQYSGAGFIGTQFLPPRLNLNDQWQKLEVPYRPGDARIQRVAYAIGLHGKDSVAWIDDASFTFNPEENPGISIEEERPATTKLRIQVETRGATAALFVGGKPVGLTNGVGTVEISEGLAPIAVKAQMKGENPGVLVKILGHPETDGRWRVGTEEVEGWTTAQFNDSKWQVASAAPDGYIWHSEGGAGSALRQVILWNETHYGPNRCIVPPVKEWGFPRGGFETLYLALYSPLPYRLEDYEFTFDVPAAIKLLDIQNYWQRYIDHLKPDNMIVEQTERDGIPFTRYRLSYEPGDVKPDGTRYTLLPLKMVGEPKGEACRFYFRRSARGNFTELEQSIPVRILPPVNGRRPKNVMISQFSPGGYTPLSKEHLEERVKADVAAGCNYYMLSYSPGWGEGWVDWMKLFHDTVTDAGCHFIYWSDFPLNYGWGTGHLAYYPAWIKEHPEAHGRYYKNQPAWGETKYKGPYCNQYVITEEGKEFWEIVKKEYERALEFYPKADMIFADWEFHNVKKDGSGVHCFCDRCKAAFKEWASLPDGTDLSDEAIMKNHYKAWLAFRDYQDSEIVRRMVDLSHELGKRHLIYTWSGNMGFWEAGRGKYDVLFPGMPGNSVADSYMQSLLDNYARSLWKKSGQKRAMGQRFVFFKNLNKDGWKGTVLSNDGFVNAKSWKPQVLRIVAALHGGVDMAESEEFAGGIRYYLGEATRILSTFEPLFWDGERADELASSEQIKYPNLLVLKRGDERLVLLFNEGDEPLEVVLENKNLKPGQKGVVFEAGVETDSPARMNVTVPCEDVTVVHIK